MEPIFITNLDGFQWDAANRDKNWKLHKVLPGEIEEVFINSPLFFYRDFKHSEKEQRILALGKTYDGRKLSIVFTIRGNHIRPISARDMSKKERINYEETIKKDS